MGPAIQSIAFAFEHCVCVKGAREHLKLYIRNVRNDANLFVGGETILSQEGTTQGDPLAMAMYALALVPMITLLSNILKQVWPYADDAAAAGHLTDLRTFSLIRP